MTNETEDVDYSKYGTLKPPVINEGKVEESNNRDTIIIGILTFILLAIVVGFLII